MVICWDNWFPLLYIMYFQIFLIDHFEVVLRTIETEFRTLMENCLTFLLMQILHDILLPCYRDSIMYFHNQKKSLHHLVSDIEQNGVKMLWEYQMQMLLCTEAAK